MEDGKWKMDGGWIEDRGWRMEDGGFMIMYRCRVK